MRPFLRNMTNKDQAARVRILGKPGSPLAYMIRDFLHRSGVPFEWIELNSDEQARTQAGVTGLNDGRLPVCLFPDGAHIECPTIRQITEKLGWFRDPSRSEYDLAIYGAGPAGLSAASTIRSRSWPVMGLRKTAMSGSMAANSSGP